MSEPSAGHAARENVLVTWMQPRDHAHAGRVISVLMLVAGAVTIVFAASQLAGGTQGTNPVAVALVTVVVVAVTFRARHWNDRHRNAWAVVPLGAVAVVVVVDYLSSDASVSAQVFLFFPALYGAAELRRPGSLLLCGACLVGEAVLVFGMLSFSLAVTDFVYVAAVLITTTLLLTRANEVRVQLIAQLTRLAAIDPLTGLVTRRVLDEAAQSALSGAAPGGGTALILLDVDNFKSINDRFGHVAGDDVLVQLSSLLTGTAGADEVVSRLGGDEIAVLLPGCSQARMVERGRQIIQDVRTLDFELPDGQRLKVTLSAGMAHAPTHGGGLRQLYAAADTGLYRAKRDGRDQIRPPETGHHLPSRPAKRDG